MGKYFLKNPQIIEDRYKLLRNDPKTFPDRDRASLGKVELPKEPTIFISNHHFKDDVLGTILAAIEELLYYLVAYHNYMEHWMAY